eukprot:gene34126-41301_t
MDFVALLSGGKDSCYNIYLSIQHGHRLVCVANLHPPEEGEQELNSFMYQSAGYTLIPAIADCLGVPLLRKPIQRGTKDQTLEYTDSDNTEDEVEDLYELLAEVKRQYPHVRAVSVGAIVSSYQRHRVEAVCQRLGLVAMAYLWQRDRMELIHEIVDKGFECFLVKVAGAGLEPRKHLNRRISDLLPTLFKYHAMYGLDVCGEGGEYESLVLDGPIFRKRIVVNDSKVVLDGEDETVGNLLITSFSVVDKEATMDMVPSLDYGNILMNTVESMQLSYPYSSAAERTSGVAHCDKTRLNNQTIENGLQEQFSDILAQLNQLLVSHGVQQGDIVFVHVYLSDMKLFGAMNDVYAKHINQFHPPSRSCIEASLPPGKLIALDAIFLRGSYQQALKNRHIRDVLHVKSLSAWAPQCIGPYAQANTIHNCLVYVAGQIPLIPGNMQLPSISSDSYMPLAADLYMCMLNIHNILTAYDGVGDGAYGDGVFDSILCMVVYVNTTVVSMSDGLHGFILQAIRTCAKQITRTNQQKSKKYSVPTEEDQCYAEDDEGSYNEEANNESCALSQLIVNMVCVSNLPRNAKVECEVIAMKSSVFPTNLLQYMEYTKELPICHGIAAASSSSPHDADLQKQDYFSLPLEKWDIWNVDARLPPTYTTITATSLHEPSSSLAVSSRQFGSSYSIRYYSDCMAAMSIVVTSESLSEVSPDFLQALVGSLGDTIQHACSSISTPKTYIQTVRCFVPISRDSDNVYLMQSMLTNRLQQQMRVLPAVVCVPVASVLGHSQSTPVAGVQIVLVDLQQVETALWVARE